MVAGGARLFFSLVGSHKSTHGHLCVRFGVARPLPVLGGGGALNRDTLCNRGLPSIGWFLDASMYLGSAISRGHFPSYAS